MMNSVINQDYVISSLRNCSDLFYQYLTEESKEDSDVLMLLEVDSEIESITIRLIELQCFVLYGRYLEEILSGGLEPKPILDYNLSRILFEDKIVSPGKCSEYSGQLERYFKSLGITDVPFLDNATRDLFNLYLDLRTMPIGTADIEFRRRGISIERLCYQIFAQLFPFFKDLQCKHDRIYLDSEKSLSCFPFFYYLDNKNDSSLLLYRGSWKGKGDSVVYRYNIHNPTMKDESVHVIDNRFSVSRYQEKFKRIYETVTTETIDDKRYYDDTLIDCNHFDKFQCVAQLFINTFDDKCLWNLVKHSPFKGDLKKYLEFQKSSNKNDLSNQALLHYFYSDSPLKAFFIAFSRHDGSIETDKIIAMVTRIESLSCNNKGYRQTDIIDTIIEKGQKYFHNFPDVLEDSVKGEKARFLVFHSGLEIFKALGIRVDKDRSQYPLLYFKTRIENINLRNISLISDDDIKISSPRPKYELDVDVPSEAISSICRDSIINFNNVIEQFVKIKLSFLEAIRLSTQSKDEQLIEKGVRCFVDENILRKGSGQGERGFRSILFLFKKCIKQSQYRESYFHFTGRELDTLTQIIDLFNRPIKLNKYGTDDSIELFEKYELNYFDIRNLLVHNSVSRDEIQNEFQSLECLDWQALSLDLYHRCKEIFAILRYQSRMSGSNWQCYYPYGVVLDRNETRYDGIIVRNYSLNHELNYLFNSPQIKIISDYPIQDKIPYYVLPHSERQMNEIWINPFIIRSSVIDNLFSSL